MKKQICLAALFLLCLHCISQQPQAIIGNSYITVVDNLVVYGVNADGSVDQSKIFKVPKGIKLNVNGLDDQNNLKVTFWTFPTSSKVIKSNLAMGTSYDYSESKEFIGAWANNRDFILPLVSFNTGCKKYYGKSNDFTWGILTLPIKARFGKKNDRLFNVEENLNLGFTFGVNHQIQGRREQSINWLLGVSLGRVSADSTTLKDGADAPESSVASALMFSMGVLYQTEGFQVGLFTGIDQIPGALGKKWLYQSKPWIGFAVGISLFSRSNAQNGTGTNAEK